MTQGNPTKGAVPKLRIDGSIRQKIARVNWDVVASKLLGPVCVLIVAGMLVAGLWPFHSPRNQVTWSSGGNGLHFGRHGMALSSGTFEAAGAPEDGRCSLELWLEPELTAASGAILVFDSQGSSRQFSLRQYVSGIGLQVDAPDGSHRTRTRWFYIANVFRRGRPVFITVTSIGAQASVYINGTLSDVAPDFPLCPNLNGELLIANSPVVDNSWSGTLRGLALYRQELTPAQAYRHFTEWTAKGKPDVSEDDRNTALYLFDERAGHIVHDHASSRTDLFIPDPYRVVDKAFLYPFWKEFHPTWSYWDDVLVNVGGFVPFGFVLCAYLSLTRRFKRPALFTVLLGLALSLTIEVLQAFLPTRGSGTTDLITNTFGTSCGVWLYQLRFWRVLIPRLVASLVGTAGGEELGPHAG